jgi:hypothetical protein
MLNNPDIRPNTTINHWMASILLFDFKLVHIPSATHGPNSLFHQLAQPDDPPEPEDNYENWINQAYRFIHIINLTTAKQESHLVLSLFTLTNAEAPADSLCQPLTTNFVHWIQAVLTDIVDTTPDFSPHVITNPSKEHTPCDNHQNKADLKLNLVVALLQGTYRPTGMIDQGFKRLIHFAQDFFLKGNVLWHKSIHGHHKVDLAMWYMLAVLFLHTLKPKCSVPKTTKHLLTLFSKGAEAQVAAASLLGGCATTHRVEGSNPSHNMLPKSCDTEHVVIDHG